MYICVGIFVYTSKKFIPKPMSLPVNNSQHAQLRPQLFNRCSLV